ncbi:hypothetical protein [Streptomyces atratus]|uniref:hypothetical protein n=1 Tax=Streptomyces atratus TaxID=1893 RepID=UPI0034060866
MKLGVWVSNTKSRRDKLTQEQLAAVAAELNGRPRKTLGWETPAERLHKLLAA